MHALLALLVGVLFAAGVYLLLSRSLVRLIFGIVLVSHAVNLVIFVSGGLVRATAPLVAKGETTVPEGAADPIPQALVLTAIVIGFALTAFTAALVRQVVSSTGTGDSDELADERSEGEA
jgi:multicomponent Na+:H+ antiporter subunit C